MRATSWISGDIADALISECAFEAGCTPVFTFDKAAVRVGMQLLC
jgi:predicted nucleic-acid-binding protein